MTEIAFGKTASRSSEPLLPQWWRTLDQVSLAAILLLFAIGITMGMAASPPLASRNGLPAFYYVNRQAFFGIIALVIMLGLSMSPVWLVRRLGLLGFVGSVVVVAALPWVGTDFGKGAVRWLSVAGMSVQPAEFLKPFFVIFAAWMIAASTDLGGPPGRSIAFVTAVGLATILALQPDFGQAALIMAGWMVMYFVAGASMVLILAVMALGLAAGWYAYHNSAHVAGRLDAFWAGDPGPTTQLGFAMNAIREGGLFGVGAGAGTVKWSLPDAHADFIVAVAAEEYGVMAVFLIVLCFAVITVRSVGRVRRERDSFVRLAAVGLASILALQALVNLGVAMRLLPAKGMTLPFVSYGGSSVVAVGILCGMLLALTRSRPQDDLGDLLSRRA